MNRRTTKGLVDVGVAGGSIEFLEWRLNQI